MTTGASGQAARAGAAGPTPASPRRHRPWGTRKAQVAACLLCGLTPGNSMNVAVLTFSITRRGRGGIRSFGVIALCDRCRREQAILPGAA